MYQNHPVLVESLFLLCFTMSGSDEAIGYYQGVIGFNRNVRGSLDEGDFTPISTIEKERL